MVNSNTDDRPLAKWTTGNLLGLLGFIAMVITGWSTLSDRVTKIETNDANQTSSILEIKRDVRTLNDKIDQLLLAEGLRPNGPPSQEDNQN